MSLLADPGDSGGDFSVCPNTSPLVTLSHHPEDEAREGASLHSELDDNHLRQYERSPPGDTYFASLRLEAREDHSLLEHLPLSQDDSSEYSLEPASESPGGSESASIHTLSSVDGEDHHLFHSEKEKNQIRKLSASEIVQHLKVHPLYRNEYFEIRQSAIAGLGAVASQELHQGDIILIEEPLFISDNYHLLHNFGNLDSDARSVALALHKYEHLKKEWTADIRAVWSANCFATLHGLSGLFMIAGRFNHACRSMHNVDFAFDPARRCLVLKVKAQKVLPGTELTICYGKELSPLMLYYQYGFRCCCGGCAGISEEEIAHLAEQW